MPMTSSPALRASIVTDEMTLLMPGAGPPPTRIARRCRVRDVPFVRDAATLVILGSLPVTRVSASLTHRKFTYVRVTLRLVSIEAGGAKLYRGVQSDPCSKAKGAGVLASPFALSQESPRRYLLLVSFDLSYQ